MEQPINNVDYAHRFFLALAGASALAMAAVLPARAQQSSPAEVQTVRIAQQFGISYLPLMVIQEQKLIERFAREAGLPEPVVRWNQFSGGGTMNDALISGSLDFASAGITPMLTLWAKTRGSLEVKAVAALAALPSFLNTSNGEVRSIKDLTERDRIALPAVKVSIQAIMLQVAAEQAFRRRPARQARRLDGQHAAPGRHGSAAVGPFRSHGAFHHAAFPVPAAGEPGCPPGPEQLRHPGGPHTLNLIYTTGKFATRNPKTTRAFLTALETADDWIKQNPKGGDRTLHPGGEVQAEARFR